MSDYKPITGELRERIGQAEHIVPLTDEPQYMQVRVNLAWLKEKLDAIDSIHAELERENERLHRELDERPIAVGPDALEAMARLERENAALKERDGCVEHPEEVMAEHGWVRGPLDADGEIWHRGDMSDSPWGEIESIVFDGYHWQISGHDTSAPWIRADSVRHAHPDTWERIIEDVLDGSCSGVEAVARCKALCERTKGGMLSEQAAE